MVWFQALMTWAKDQELALIEAVREEGHRMYDEARERIE